jgi:polysaccharide pyruvyl transferase WcaK-like protein
MMLSEAESARRVLLLGATFATDNMGVGALASGAISILARRYPDAQISFLDYGREPTRSPVKLDGSSLEIPLINLRFSWKVFLRNNIVYLLVLAGLSRALGERFAQRASQSNPWFKSIREADVAVAVSGGDSFSDIYGLGRFFYVYLPQLLVLWLGTKLVLLPQTIGPFRTRLARRLAEWLLNRAQRIYSREQAGVEDVQQLLGNTGAHVRFCYDMGFILEPHRPTHGLDELEELKRSGRLLVGFNVSGLLLMGGYDRSNAFDLKIDYRDLVERAIEFFIRSEDADVILVPHVFGDQLESDATACAALYNEMKHRYEGRLACIHGHFDQNEIKFIIGQCDFFVGARMHACIAALSQGIPAIGIAYSKKFLGVFQTVDAGDLVADPRHLTIEQILETIDNAMQSRVEIAARLRKTMVDVKRDLYAALDGIA